NRWEVSTAGSRAPGRARASARGFAGSLAAAADPAPVAWAAADRPGPGSRDVCVGVCGEAGDGHYRGLVADLAEQARCCDHVTGDVHAVAAAAGGAVAPGGAGQVEGAGFAGEAELPPPGLAVAPPGVGGVEEGFEAGDGVREVFAGPQARLGLDQAFSCWRGAGVGGAVVLGGGGLVGGGGGKGGAAAGDRPNQPPRGAA